MEAAARTTARRKKISRDRRAPAEVASRRRRCSICGRRPDACGFALLATRRSRREAGRRAADRRQRRASITIPTGARCRTCSPASASISRSTAPGASSPPTPNAISSRRPRWRGCSARCPRPSKRHCARRTNSPSLSINQIRISRRGHRRLRHRAGGAGASGLEGARQRYPRRHSRQGARKRSSMNSP